MLKLLRSLLPRIGHFLVVFLRKTGQFLAYFGWHECLFFAGFGLFFWGTWGLLGDFWAKLIGGIVLMMVAIVSGLRNGGAKAA